MQKKRLHLLCATAHVLLSIYLNCSHLSEGSMSEDVSVALLHIGKWTNLLGNCNWEEGKSMDWVQLLEP